VRAALFLIMGFVLSGCAVTVNQHKTVSAPAVMLTEPHTFESADAIKKLMLGISREEALALIGRTTTTGYELKGASEYKPVTVANPYRSQKITKGSDVFVVDYYLTAVHKADGVVSDDELTPLVFQADKLIGKGWEFFNEKIKQTVWK
jgi:hypothetical protein